MRYAENILRGEFWVWNTGEPPIWGASAPLYPLLIAIPMRLGVPASQAVVGTGMVLMSSALALTAAVLRSRLGWTAALAFVAFAALDSGLMYFGAAGLESPLTVLLLAIAVRAAIVPATPVVVGLVAGLLAVHKLDLAPAGALLLAAVWVRDGREPRVAAAVAALVAVAWYAFAWFMFDEIVPNSFVTKSLYQSTLPQTVDWRWFGTLVLLLGAHPWLVLLATRVPAIGPSGLAITVLLAGTLGVHLFAVLGNRPVRTVTTGTRSRRCSRCACSGRSACRRLAAQSSNGPVPPGGSPRQPS